MSLSVVVVSVLQVGCQVANSVIVCCYHVRGYLHEPGSRLGAVHQVCLDGLTLTVGKTPFNQLEIFYWYLWSCAKSPLHRPG